MAAITHNFAKVNKQLSDIPKNELFARVVALTRMAKKIQLVTREQLEDKFELKNTWVKRGVRIKPATKVDPKSEVFSLDIFMGVQDVGGRRTDQDEFWVPGRDFERITGVNPRKRVIPRKWRNPKIFDQRFKIEAGARSKNVAKAFRLKTKSGTEVVAVRRRSTSSPLAILWLIHKRSINIRGRQYFEREAEAAYDRDFQILYDAAFDRFVLKRL